ncbi:hypothetical protein [Sphingobium sp. D43FB]|uniref:hypothetical protein n=1 Tax=Sphingobium sp. D43FB TaxID=2017595 RepID=UPI000BC6165C|nr:hypothetical protein [Sphingobium sp. D43FB]PBN44670.1 hypothetical protein SxD43FB_05770 [Sphingobium sp. D43FB]|tara:strand:+ start:101 stop:325 length:225 start_codon:yes stop_codon:yes gene_type:complete
MTHRPSVPPGSTAPYPAHTAPHAESIQADALSTEASEVEQDTRLSGPVKILGAAVGIGSAAIVAALLYARQRRD